MIDLSCCQEKEIIFKYITCKISILLSYLDCNAIFIKSLSSLQYKTKTYNQKRVGHSYIECSVVCPIYHSNRLNMQFRKEHISHI